MVLRLSEYVSFKQLHKYAAMLKYHKGYGAAVDSLNVLVLRFISFNKSPRKFFAFSDTLMNDSQNIQITFLPTNILIYLIIININPK